MAEFVRSGLGSLFVPHIVLDHISELDPRILLELGRPAVLVDLDNTLLTWGQQELDPEVTTWVTDGLAAGLKLCMLSNTRSHRAATYAERLGIPYVGRALKPRRGAARNAMKKLGSRPEGTAIVGDQLFTDVLLGKRLGLYTILVKPHNLKEQMWMRMVRRVERVFWPSS
ncbi:MAG: YqeG family HAD IIIA-type phosphatase [Armatimonadetes bacterium]|nr:YqeG family HAD IIIA-type phosphatase [Armatimonadota bacterium]